MPDSSLQSCLRRLLPIPLFLLLAARCGIAEDVASFPKPTGYVTDLAHVLSPPDQADLELFCIKVHEQLDAQFAIVTINTLNGRPIEDFGIDLGRKWGIGGKGRNDGLLMLLVVQDHKQRIEVGRGLEQYLNDAFAGDTERAMQPLLRAGNYGAALKQGALALATRLAQGENRGFSEAQPLPSTQRQPQPDASSEEGIPWPIIIFAIVFVLFFILSRRGGGGRGGSSGFWTGMILNSMLNSGRGGNWGGGGGFGGGNSGGGGGFGGFGGGDFGGGGASSDW